MTLRNVFASSNSRITLPFHTSWENQDPIGRMDSVDWEKDIPAYYTPHLKSGLPPDYNPSDQDSWTENTLDGWYGGNAGGPYISTLNVGAPGSHSIESRSNDTMSDGWGTIGRAGIDVGYPVCAVNYAFHYNTTSSYLNMRRHDIFLMEDANNYFWRRTWQMNQYGWNIITFPVGSGASSWNVTGNPSWDQINEFKIRIVGAYAFKVDINLDHLYFTIDKQRLRVREFGYDGGNSILEASTYFGSSYSFVYFNLFDQTADSNYQPPFAIKPQIFIDIWYYHYQLANSMIDAQLFNKRTGQWTTLRDFSYQGKFIVDQNNVRLHPACRGNDPINSWQFVAFDLSTIWQSDPGNWFITKIWVGFDNDPQYNLTPVLGQAKTFFDLLSITYGAYGETSHTQNGGDNAWASGSLVAWDSYHRTDGLYNLYLKASCLGFDNGTWSEYLSTYSITPQTLRISSVNRGDAQVQSNPNPVGSNLTMKNATAIPESVQKFVYDGIFAVTDIATGVPVGTVTQLALDVWGLLSSPEPKDFYEWPAVHSSGYTDNPKRALGEAVILIPGLSTGTTSITVNFSVDFGYWRYYVPYAPTLVIKETLSVPVTINWSDPNSFDPPANNNPPLVSITYPSYDQSFGPGATFIASANVYPPVYYLLNQQTINGRPGYVFAKLTDSSGQPVGGYDWRPMQCSQKFTETEDEGGTFIYLFNLAALPVNTYYYIYVQAQATNGANQITSPIRIYYYDHPPNTPSQPSGATVGYYDRTYSYSTKTSDPDGNNIYYEFNWDDGQTTLIGAYPSNTTVSASHTWNFGGTFYVKVRAKDIYGAWSGWSSTLMVTIRGSTPLLPGQ